MYDYEKNSAEIYRQSFATIRAEAFHPFDRSFDDAADGPLPAGVGGGDHARLRVREDRKEETTPEDLRMAEALLP